MSLEDPEIGLLLWLILDAAGETEIGEPPYINSAKGVRLSADNLEETAAGSTVRRGSGDEEITATFEEDGTLPLSLAGNLMDTGTWWVEEDMLCVQFNHPDVEGGCNYVVLDGATIKLFDLDGALEMQFEYSR